MSRTSPAPSFLRRIPPYDLAALASLRGYTVRCATYYYPAREEVEVRWEYTDGPVDGPWWEWR